MDAIIVQAIYSIDKIIKSISHTSMVATKYCQLIALRDDLNKLVEKDLLNNDFTRLFCRRLKKRINNQTKNIERQCKLWIDIYEDLLYVLYGSNARQDKRNWEYFLARMELEGKLEQRELQFAMIVGRRKPLYELLCIHRKVLDEYLRMCISFHSKVQVRDMFDNIDNLLCCTYGQKEVSLTTEGRVRLQKKLKCIDINFDCSNISVQQSRSISSVYEKSSNKNDKNIDSYLPSISRGESENYVSMHQIATVLQDKQWAVILGDPRCAKTTLLRWMTRVYAEAALHEDDTRLFRIPILIRMNEFAEWLKQHPNLTLMDYIGKHTWFSQSYNHDDIGSVLKEFVYHGYALILLDGLNEIPILAQRREIVDLIKSFINDYVYMHDFRSPFDDVSFYSWKSSQQETIHLDTVMSLSKEHSNNQIIITSRIVGYELCPLNSVFIKHYSLNAMKWKDVLEFANQFVKQVEQNIRVTLLDEGIDLGEIRQETLTQRSENIMNMIRIRHENSIDINPFMISLFCMQIFRSSDKCVPKSPIEVYDYGVQSLLCAWRSLKSNIPENILTEFFTDLAFYLHLQSPSNLIDEFDMKNLCCLTLKRLNVSNNRKKLEKYTNKFISLLYSNIGIVVAEPDLQFFRFTHYFFQRYFIVQSLVRESSVKDVIIRVFKFVTKRRFYELLLMAIGWISWKWSFNNYNHFCNLLISYPTEHVLPLGTLLLFDALKYLHNLPSKEIIFKAFNNLIDHPSKLISRKYITSSQLPIELIVEWIQLNITNEKRLFTFCHCLLHSKYPFPVDSNEDTLKTASPLLFQQLWTLRSISQTAEIAIDYTLHKIIKSYDGPDHIFENELYSYLLSHNIGPTNIHPLIFSTILVLCGGLHLTYEDDIGKVQFSPKAMHRESSMIKPIIEYLINIQQTHSIKVQTLIEKYENILQKSSPKDTSPEIIDAFIALICLHGVSKPSMYDKFNEYEALPLVLQRFKQIFLYLRNLYRSCNSIHFNQCSLVSEIESIINDFFRQPNQSDEQLIVFSFACITAWKKLDLRALSYFVNCDVIHKSNIGRYLDIQFEYYHYITQQQQNKITNNNNNILQMTEYTSFDLLVFVPQSLQQLFYHLIISPLVKSESLPLIILLSECLIRLENIKCYGTNHYFALSLLYPLCKENQLENYCSVLFSDNYYGASQQQRKQFIRQVKNRELLDRFSTDVPENWEFLINQERERIRIAMLNQNDGNLHLFSACLSLARLFQARYRSFKNQNLKDNISILTTESGEIYFAIENLSDPTLQLIVLSLILRLNKPLIFTDEQINRLNRKIIVLLNNLLPNLPLLSSTYLFIQYYERLQSFPNFLRQFITIIGGKFNENTIDKQHQESAYIALRMLNDINLSCYLLKFEKQTTHLSDLLHFNSTTFFHYLSNNSLFDSPDITLLSSMYLIELSADVQILEIYTNKNSIKTISPLEELDQLWNHPLKNKEIMTIEVAIWITKYLKSSNRECIHGIIERISSCCIVEEPAYKIIHTWRDYRTDKDLKFFVYYAALFSIGDDSIRIINEMFDTHNHVHFETIIKSRLELESITSSLASNILIPIIQGAYRISAHTSARIHCIEIFDFILTMERERVLSNKSFLSVIRGWSKNLDYYFIQHLKDVNIQNQFANTSKEQYLIAIIKWIILESIDTNSNDNMSIEIYECLMTFLHNQQIPLVQTTLANGINAVLICDRANKGHVLISDDLKKQLEDVIAKTNIDREDLLAACLLPYGNCLLKFNDLEMNQNVSVEMQNLLARISLMSSSEIVY